STPIAPRPRSKNAPSPTKARRPSITLPAPATMVYTITVHLHANDHPDSVDRLKAKLIEASRVYSQDRETVSWFVMQDIHDPRSFTIVERFETEFSQKYHLENPYWKTFDPYVVPLLDRPMDLRRHEELDTSKDVVVPQ
ncbi:antibiotic biosynthesis monooxygenase protein, partial [Colletotrichum tofieldiae]